jgi:glycosyltransferase involved in cell wall biosynthesis
MAGHYRGVHVTVAPFTDPERCKPVPNSLIESLACGRPVLLTERTGLVAVVREAGAGRVCPPTGEGLAEHLDRLRADWGRYARNARRLAEGRFGVEKFVAGYRRLYAEILPGVVR